MKLVRCLSLTLGILSASNAFAVEWGVTAGYNNPPGSALGLSLMPAWKNVAIELGLGSIAADSDREGTDAAVGGDIDVKLLTSGTWRLFGELGWHLGFGARARDEGGVSAGAGDAFAGAGAFYWGSKFLFFVKGGLDLDALRDADFDETFASFGLGVRI